MALQNQDVICTNCSNYFNAKPKRTIVGFLKFKCPKCQKNFDYPFTSSIRIANIILVIWGIALIVQDFPIGVRSGFSFDFFVYFSVHLIIIVPATMAVFGLIKDAELRGVVRTLSKKK